MAKALAGIFLHNQGKFELEGSDDEKSLRRQFRAFGALDSRGFAYLVFCLSEGTVGVYVLILLGSEANPS